MDGAIMGMIAVVIPIVGATIGLVSKIHKTIEKMDKRLTGIESMLKENRK